MIDYATVTWVLFGTIYFWCSLLLEKVTEGSHKHN